jgi:hypothetical protein
MTGATMTQARACYQQKKNATVTPPTIDIPPSSRGPRLSELIPFIIAVSLAIALVKTPDECSL